jgi:ribulose-5-phosphate 4-epimerase/fuculose-1-phosphate aldolase
VSETGSIKFSCEHVPTPLAEFGGFAELNACRRKLLQLRMLGVDGNGIGFGNVSVRDRGTPDFYITGSMTGALPQLRLADCAKVTAFAFSRNWVRCEGETVASSESLTHAAVYESDETASAVIHGHNAELWERLRDRVPTTSADVEYGTPGMAHEVQRLFQNTEVRQRRLFVMGGHRDGIVAFGGTLNEALAVLQRALIGT